MTIQTHDVVVEEVSADEGRDMLNRETLAVLSITREKFLAGLDRGDYDGTDREDIIRLRLLAPYGR